MGRKGTPVDSDWLNRFATDNGIGIDWQAISELSVTHSVTESEAATIYLQEQCSQELGDRIHNAFRQYRYRLRRAEPSAELGPTVYDELFIGGTLKEWKPSLVDRLHHVRRLIDGGNLGHAFDPSDARQACEGLAKTLFALVRCMDTKDLEMFQKNTGITLPAQVTKQIGEALPDEATEM